MIGEGRYRRRGAERTGKEVASVNSWMWGSSSGSTLTGVETSWRRAISRRRGKRDQWRLNGDVDHSSSDIGSDVIQCEVALNCQKKAENLMLRRVIGRKNKATIPLKCD